MERLNRQRKLFMISRPSLRSKIFSVERSSLIAEFFGNELTGTTARDSSPAAMNGTYSNVTLNATTYRGQPIPSYNGTSSVLSFTNAILGTKGTGFMIARVSAVGDWSDATVRFLMRIQVDANNLLFVQKTNTNNQLQIRYRAGSTEKSIALLTSTTDFFKLVWTWGDLNNGNALNLWFNGVAQTPQATFGAFTGTITTKNFSENSANSWKGNIGRIGLWNSILSEADIAILNAA